MELSTNIPIPMQSPASDITFKLMPVKYIIMIANKTLNGILNATTKVGLTSFKNKASTIIARTAPSKILCNTLSKMVEISESQVKLVSKELPYKKYSR